MFARSASICDCKGYARWKHGSVVFLPRRLLASFVDMYLRAYFCVERQICFFMLQRLICATAFHLPARSFASHRLASQTLVDELNDGFLQKAGIAFWWLPRCSCGRSAPDADVLKHQSILQVCESDVVKNETKNGVDIALKMKNRCAQRIQKPKWKIERRTM